MLCLSRKAGQTIIFDGGVTIHFQRIDGSRVKVAIDAPRDVKILRGEVAERDGHGVLDQTVPLDRSVSLDVEA